MQDFNDSVLLIDKPYGWTSFQVIRKLQYGLKIKKMGHAGTLDPLATGLLILCTGKKTKEIDSYQAQIKEYTGELLLGKTTASFDLETDFDSSFDADIVNQITENDILEALKKFQGEIDQVPPIYSAIKIDGQRLYEKARKGEEIEIKSRKVTIESFEITDFSKFPFLSFKIICSKGTYIRSLVRDLGVALGIGACMTALRRTAIGNFRVEDAYTIAGIAEKVGFEPEIKGRIIQPIFLE
jgi:tRNA pseudouridine55 synthase